MLPRLPFPGSTKGPVLDPVIAGIGVKYVTVRVMGSNEPGPTWNEPDPLFGRQTFTSSSIPHAAVGFIVLVPSPPKVGVQGRPPLHLVVLVNLYPPTRQFLRRPELP